MAYVPFLVDKDTLKQIFEKTDEEVETTYRIATGADLLNKPYSSVSENEIKEFVEYQQIFQVVNQLLGNIRIQPADLDIKKEVENVLKENERKLRQVSNHEKEKEPMPAYFEKPLESVESPIRINWIRQHIGTKENRALQRKFTHYIVIHKINITGEQFQQILLNSYNEKPKVH